METQLPEIKAKTSPESPQTSVCRQGLELVRLLRGHVLKERRIMRALCHQLTPLFLVNNEFADIVRGDESLVFQARRKRVICSSIWVFSMGGSSETILAIER